MQEITMGKTIGMHGLLDIKPIKDITESITLIRKEGNKIDIRTVYSGSLYLLLSYRTSDYPYNPERWYEKLDLSLINRADYMIGRDIVSLSYNVDFEGGIPMDTAFDIYSRIRSPEEFYRLIERKEKFIDLIEGRTTVG